jgi:hypothetical protein
MGGKAHPTFDGAWDAPYMAQASRLGHQFQPFKFMGVGGEGLGEGVGAMGP